MDTTASRLAEALRRHQSGELEEAGRLYQEILATEPEHFDALHLAGLAAYRRGCLEEAVSLFTRAVAVNPNSWDACYRLGNALVRQDKLEQAIGWYRQATQLKDHPGACYNLATALVGLGRTGDAIGWYEKAVRLKPDYPEACFNLGNVLWRAGHLEEAVKWFRRTLQIDPKLIAAHNNLGNVLMAQGDLETAMQHYLQVLELDANHAEASNNLGNVFMKQGRYEEAADCYERALEDGPGSAEIHKNLGMALANQGKRAAAIQSFRTALQLDPDHVPAQVQLLLNQQHLCEWEGTHELAAKVIRAVESGSAEVAPHAFLSVEGSTPAAQLVCARTWAKMRFDGIIQGAREHVFSRRSRDPDRLTIGYLSADFREHPVAFTMVEVIEKHDRGRFRVVGYSCGQDDGSAIRQRLVGAFDDFVELTSMSHLDAARRIHDNGVDILIDLMGYTRDSRLDVAALRPAPVQASYWGYCGTTGASFIDYLLVDEFVVPEEHAHCYAEELVYLPGCYMPYDSEQEVSTEALSREDHGLPGEGVVFCSFNNSYKIAPSVFDVWMRLLTEVGDSVLWLLSDRDEAMQNLRREAEARGVESQRLVFARRVPRPEHLARLHRADLFLDTIPYNAHTTASDALWAGCPVVTVAGETFPSRVAGSALRAVGIGELVTSSLEEYEQLALRLATSPRERSDLRERLAGKRKTSRLFDGTQKARDLEEAYHGMWETVGGRPSGGRKQL